MTVPVDTEHVEVDDLRARSSTAGARLISQWKTPSGAVRGPNNCRASSRSFRCEEIAVDHLADVETVRRTRRR